MGLTSAVKEIKYKILFAKKRKKKNTPRAKLIFAKVIYLPFSFLNFSSANSSKPFLRNKLGKIYEIPTPENVPIKPKSGPIESIDSAKTTSTAYRIKVQEL